jgi:hypothetical protein
MKEFVKANRHKVLFAVLYLLVVFVFIYTLDGSNRVLEERLRDFPNRPLHPGIYMLLRDLVLTLPISLIFSFNHILSLFRQKVTVRIINLVVVVLLSFPLIVIIFLPNSVVLSPLVQTMWRIFPFSVSFGQARVVVFLLFWYNLIFAFRKKELTKEESEEDIPCEPS